MKTSSFLLAAAALATPAFAQGGDDCSTATAIGATGAFAFDTTAATVSNFDGGGAPCAMNANQDLFWQFTAPAAGDYQFDTFGSTYDTRMSVHSGVGCAATCIGTNDDFGSLQSRVDVLGVNAGDQILIQVGGFGASSFGAGTLNVSTIVNLCATPDAFEDDDDCASATPIGDGTYMGLNVTRTDPDFFSFAIADGATFDLTLTGNPAPEGDIDVYLWDPTIDCGTASAGEGAAPTGSLAVGFAVGANETISYTNTTGAAQNVILEIDVWDGGSADSCNSNYEFTMTGATGGGPTVIGTPFCAANNNSTGLPGLLTATGSDVAADNDVTLSVSQIPALQFGIFTVSDTAGAMTPVNSGILCLSGMIGRYTMPGQIWQADMAGEASLALDMTMVPRPMTIESTNAGDTWFFQAWHRDIPIGNSNFTTGVEITFN